MQSIPVLILVVGLFLGIGGTAMAADISVASRCYKEHGAGNDQNVLQFMVNYLNPALPRAARVTLHRGLSGWINDSALPTGGSAFEWNFVRDESAMTGPASSRRATTTEVEHHGTFYERFSFVFRIEFPDGQVAYDNAGTPNGFYFVDLPRVKSCGARAGRYQAEVVQLQR